LKINRPGREDFDYVSRKFEDGEILSDEAVERYPSRCFMLKDRSKLPGSFNEFFVRPA
jgi:hypothetical protein